MKTRLVSLAAGIVVAAVAFALHGDMSVHMVQHLLLIAVAPALLALGKPVRVPFVPPVAAFVLYTAVLVGTHLTPFLGYAMAHPGLHVAEELGYLVTGYLFLVPVVDGRSPHVFRFALLMGAMVVDTVVGVAMLMTPGESDDMRWSGAAMWVGGDLLMAALAIVVISRWLRDPDRRNDLGPWLDSARRSALDVGDDPDGEAALHAYNERLAELARRDQRHR